MRNVRRFMPDGRCVFILGGVSLGALKALDKISIWIFLILLLCLLVLADVILYLYDSMIEEEYKQRYQAESDDVPSTMKE